MDGSKVHRFTLYFLDHVYYRWTRSTYRATVDRYIGRQSTDISVMYRSSIGQVSVMYRSSIDGLRLYRSTHLSVDTFIGRLSADISVDYRPIVGRLSTDMSTEATHDPRNAQITMLEKTVLYHYSTSISWN